MGNATEAECAINTSAADHIPSESTLDQNHGVRNEPPSESIDTTKEIKEGIVTEPPFETAGKGDGLDELTQNAHEHTEPCHDEEEGWGQVPEGENEAFDGNAEAEGYLYNNGERLYGIPDSDNVEKVEYYCPQGFHPVKLGDEFNQYKVVHKLGYGGFATVWLARDAKEHRYVALKIILAQGSENAEKYYLQVLDHLEKCVADDAQALYLDLPVDHFWIEGPNGRHICLVSHFHGPSIASFSITSFGSFFGRRFRPGLKESQRMALQLTQSLAFMHEAGIAHGDLTTSNVLLELENMDAWSIDELYGELGNPKKEPVYSYNREPLGSSAPEYLYEKADLTRLISRRTGNIRIVDFGESFYLKDPPMGLGTPAAFCSPELMLEKKCGKASDIWALACTIFVIRAGDSLFQAYMGSDGEALREILSILGPAPSHLDELRDLHQDDEGSRAGSSLKSHIKEITTVEYDGMSKREAETSKISDDEAEVLYDMLHQALDYDSEKRITADKMLRHPWFSKNF